MRRAAIPLSASAAVFAAAAVFAQPPASPAPAPAGDASVGAILFLQCRACHVVGAQAAGVGPNLSGVVGAKAGARPGYSYSAAMTASGIVWTPAALDKFLTKPTASVPGTRMAFAGIASPKARADVIAYLTTLKAPR